MSDAQKFEFLRGLLLDVSSAVQDLRDGVQGLYEKSRRAVPNVGDSRGD